MKDSLYNISDVLSTVVKGQIDITKYINSAVPTIKTVSTMIDIQDKVISNKFNNLSGIVSADIKNLADNYYNKSEVMSAIAGAGHIKIKVVQTLPEVAEAETNTIYLVPRSKTELNNIYDEYIIVNNTWQKIGSTDIDLSNYLRNDQDGVLSGNLTTYGLVSEYLTTLAVTSNDIYASHALSASSGTIDTFYSKAAGFDQLNVMSAYFYNIGITSSLIISGNINADNINTKNIQLSGYGYIDFGKQNQIFLKGYYYKYFDLTNLANKAIDIYLTSTQVRYAEGIANQALSASEMYDSSFICNYTVGQIISITNSTRIPYCGKIQSIDGNKLQITYLTDNAKELFEKSTSGWYDNGYLPQEEQATDQYSLYSNQHPEIGQVLIYDKRGGIFNGVQCYAGGIYTLNTGYKNYTLGNYSVAIGRSNYSYGYATFAAGRMSQGIGNYSFAQGQDAQSYGQYSHAEGKSTKATGPYSHTEGEQTSTSHTARSSHAEGYKSTIRNAYYSHAEGFDTLIRNDQGTITSGAHAEGIGTIANNNYQHIEGKYNATDSSKAIIVGGGSSTSDRKNIYTLDWNGNAQYSGNLTIGTGLTTLSGNSTLAGNLTIGNNLTLLSGNTIKTTGNNGLTLKNDLVDTYLNFSKSSSVNKMSLNIGSQNNVSIISITSQSTSLTALSGRLTLKSKGATNLETADLRLNNNKLNLSGGLVKVNNNGKIDQILYNNPAGNYLPLSGGTVNGEITFLSGINGNLIVEKNITLLSGTTIKTTGSNGFNISNDLAGNYVCFDKPSDVNKMRLSLGGSNNINYIAANADSILFNSISGRLILRSKGATNLETTDLRLNQHKLNTSRWLSNT